MTSARSLGKIAPPQQSEEAALARLIATGAELLVLAATDDCPPCTLMKPIVRHLALRFSVELRLGSPLTAPGLLARHAVERFPELLLFRDGRLLERRAGFHGFEDLTVFMRHALGRSEAAGETEQDIAFRTLIDEALAAVDASMDPASAALAPFMQAAATEFEALDTRLASIAKAGKMSPKEANRLRRAEQQRIYAPFQDKIDALLKAQAQAMRRYQEITDQAMGAFGAAASGSNSTVVCSPDGSVCHIVVRGHDETVR